jgi:hypothetical protein
MTTALFIITIALFAVTIIGSVGWRIHYHLRQAAKVRTAKNEEKRIMETTIMPGFCDSIRPNLRHQ